jgi:hypothetical protein
MVHIEGFHNGSKCRYEPNTRIFCTVSFAQIMIDAVYLIPLKHPVNLLV